jgi:hypothetical protein
VVASLCGARGRALYLMEVPREAAPVLVAERLRLLQISMGRRNEVVYRPAVSRFDRAAVHFKDRDELNRRVPR